MSNVHKFIAEKGIEEAKRVSENAPVNSVELRSNGLYYSASGLYWCNVNKQFFESLTPNKFLSVNLSELKQVVESVEIVKELGSLKSAKANVREMYVDYNCDYVHPRARLYDYKHLKIGRVIKAIKDYELVEKYKGENNG